MADISKIVGLDGTSYNIKDATARSSIASLQNAMSGGVTFIGETTTSLSDGSETMTVSIGGSNKTAAAGNLVVSGNKEFLFDGSKWIEMGDLSVLGALAYKGSASGSYTPAGSVSQPTFSGSSMTATGNFTPAGTVSISKGTGAANYTPEGSVTAPTISVKTAGSTTTVNSITDVGSLPSMSMTVANETLTFSFSQGSLPTKGANTTVKTGDAAYQATTPTFSGTGVELKASFSGAQGSVSVTGTPAGTVTKPTFSGTAATISVS